MFAKTGSVCLVLIGSVFISQARCDDRSTTASRESLAPFVAELSHGNVHRRTAAAAALLNRTPNVQRLLQEAVDRPESTLWVKRVLAHWAKTDARAHTELFLASTKPGPRAGVAEAVLNAPAVRRAQWERTQANLRLVARVSKALALRGHNHGILAAVQRSVDVIRTCGPPAYVRLFMPIQKCDRDEPPPTDRQRMAGHLIQVANRALENGQYRFAMLFAIGSHVCDEDQWFASFLVTDCARRRMNQWCDAHIEEPAIGVAATLTRRRFEVRQEYRLELAARWKDRLLWPARIFGRGLILPIYSRERDIRARELIFH